ncbi:UPF0280 family protein [Noviherbaspirillum saxi]|uniref:UPF0280 family protein n=2 Tax=Noviherbaspirillum saxi TaxID=2320863 RepID=A0A3A3FS88_9BURK|nr:UPF0280 family protein [Noviherbaspirillum saxi]RJF96352.1 UPF0280 family protein [Noviherbaspirillum saxi]
MPRCVALTDGRLHFSHGPIDLIIQADGAMDAVNACHEQAWQRFETILSELVSELPALRQPVGDICMLNGAIARRMWDACHPFRARYITPMAAVAGAVAQEIIRCYEKPFVTRAAINNGGDIALHLSAGTSYCVGVCTDIDAATIQAVYGADLDTGMRLTIEASMPVRGIATSGWRGRSFSLGIADSVTVLAASAAQADAAATMIANTVNVDDARIKRQPACTLKDDTDLGAIPVTVDVPPLDAEVVHEALHYGLERARQLQASGLIWSAILVCQEQVVVAGRMADGVAEKGIAAAMPTEQRLNAMPASRKVRFPAML